MPEKNIYNFPKPFLIKIINNNSNTWQGIVSSPYWKKERTFCSSLELMEIINEEIKKTTGNKLKKVNTNGNNVF